jgi:hypothetical protein
MPNTIKCSAHEFIVSVYFAVSSDKVNSASAQESDEGIALVRINAIRKPSEYRKRRTYGASLEPK